MSNTDANNLSRDKIRQLLAVIGSGAAQDTTHIEATEYDWRQPHCFNSSQLNKLNDFTKKIAEIIAEKFAGVYHSDFNVTAASITQHFAGELCDQILNGGQNNYYLAFGTDQENLFGFISVSEQTATAWVTELLGEADSEKDAKNSDSQEQPGKALSQLEETLLFDIVSAIVESLTISLRSLSADYNVWPAKALVKSCIPIELSEIEEMCKIVFNIEKAAPSGESDKAELPTLTDSQVCLFVSCSRMAHHWAVVGTTTEADKKLSADDISKAIIDHIQQMPVSVSAQLGVAELSFEQIMSLSPYDVLLLNKTIDETVELIVEGQTLFLGQPAKSAGQQAVVITDLGDLPSAGEKNINPVKNA